MTRIGIFTATRWECQAACRAIQIDTVDAIGGNRCYIGRRQNHQVLVVATGVGPLRAGEAGREVLAAYRMDAAVSAGVACALVPCNIGDLLIGTDVMVASTEDMADETMRLPCTPGLSERAWRLAAAAGIPVHVGPVLAWPRVVWLAQEKQRLADRMKAIFLDMESGALARAAMERGVPFLVARTVSDLLDEDLPMDFNLFMHRQTFVQGVWYCLRRPSRLLGLRRLALQTRVASRRLTTFLERWLDGGMDGTVMDLGSHQRHA